ncbi:MAG: DPP IV N-terminal domain-containing protein [Dehalococcoidia bacterium]|nr:DPP IV N-terminal domain-containing protein [Dehalococcoidia bacterium]
MTKLVSRVVLFGLVVLLSACSVVDRPAPTPAPTTVPRVKTSITVGGKLLFVRSGNIWTWDNGNLKQLTKGGSDTQPSWSPDGGAMAYVKRDESRSNIMVSNSANGFVRALTNTQYWGGYSGWLFRPTWSPDGKKIAFLSDEGSYDLALWTMNADGTGRTRIASASQSGGLDSPTWSPDGKQIAMAGYRSATSQVWVYTTATGKWQQITKAGDGAYDPRWSPDGKRIVFVVRDVGKSYVWLMNADGENARQLTSDGAARAPTWSFDGQFIAYISGAAGSGFDIWALKIDEVDGQLATSEPKQLTKISDVDPGAGLSWYK